MKLYFAPLNKLGNSAFRRLVLDYNVDFVFSEMIILDKLLQGDKNQIQKAMIPCDMQGKTIIQVLAEDINNIEKGIEVIMDLNPKCFEINYNMGCPQSTLCKKEIGGGIIKNLQKVKVVAKQFAKICKKYDVTPSIKTRIGITRNDINIFENLKNIKNCGITKMYLHGRVLKEPYTKPATYNEIKQAKKQFPELEIIGNGDICDTISFIELLSSKIDGIMIGRAALQNPEIFKELKSNENVEKQKCGINIKLQKNVILKFVKYAKEYSISLNHVKANLAYLTKGVVGGTNFRQEINRLKDINDIIEFCHKI